MMMLSLFITLPFYNIKTYDNYKTPLSSEQLFYTSRFFYDNWQWKTKTLLNKDILFYRTMEYYNKIKNNGKILNAYYRSNNSYIIGSLAINYNGLEEIKSYKLNNYIRDKYSSRCYPLLTNLLVLEKYRKKKIGSKLVKKALKELGHLDFRYVFVLVEKSKPELKMFYYKLGFRNLFNNSTKELYNYFEKECYYECLICYLYEV